MHSVDSRRPKTVVKSLLVAATLAGTILTTVGVGGVPIRGDADRIPISASGVVHAIASETPVELEIGRIDGVVVLGGVRAPGLRVTGGGPSTTVRVDGDINIDAMLEIEIDGHLEIDTSASGRRIRVEAGEGLSVAVSALRLADTPGAPVHLRSGGDLVLEGRDLIDVDALDDHATRIASGADLILRSARPVRGDAHWRAGRDLRIETLDGRPGNLVSPKDPVVLSTRNVTMGAYTGASLHILAGGSVATGAIEITGTDGAANTIGPGNTVAFNGTDTFADLADLVLSDGTPVVVDGAARATLDIRAGIDWSSFSGGPPVPDDRIVPGGSVSPTFSSPVASADIVLGSVVVTVAEGVVLLTNRYCPNAALTGAIETDGVSTLTNTDGSDGGDIWIDSKADVVVPELFSYSQSSTTGGASGSGGSVSVIADGDLVTTSVITLANSLNGTAGNGGAVSLRIGGTLVGNPTITASSWSQTGSGNGGDVIVDARGPMAVNGVYSESLITGTGTAGNGGAVSVLARAAGGVNGGEPLTVYEVVTGSGPVAGTGVVVASGNGGQVELRTEDGDVEVVTRISTASQAGSGVNPSGDGGDVFVTAVGGDIAIGLLWTDLGITTRTFAADGSTGNTGEGGDVTLTADGGIRITPGAPAGGVITSTTSDGGQAGRCGAFVAHAATGNIDLGFSGIQTDADGRAGVSGPAGPVGLTAGGSILTAFIDTSSIGRSGGSAAAGGTVTIAGGGSVSTGDVNAQSLVEDAGGSADHGGTVMITTSAGDLATGYVATTSVSAAGGGDSGAGGSIVISGPGDLHVNPGRSYGSGSISMSAVAGPGGDIEVTLGGAVTGLANVSSASVGETGGGTGGSLILNSTGPLALGSVRSNSSVRAAGAAGNGGAVQLISRGPAGGVSVAEVHSDSGCFYYFGADCAAATSGAVTLTAESGDVVVSDEILTHSIAKGVGNNTGDGGDVAISAPAGLITIGAGGIATRTECVGGGLGNAGIGGDVDLTAAGDITLAGVGINSSALSEGGSAAGGGSVLLASATGSVDLAGADISAGATSTTGTAGPAGGIGISTGPGGAIDVGNLLAHSFAENGASTGPGGAVTINTGDALGLGDVYSFSRTSTGLGGDGGDVTVALGGSLATTPKISTMSRGATAAGHGGDVVVDVVGAASFDSIDTSTRLTGDGVALTSGDVSITVHNLGGGDGGDELVVAAISADAGAWTVPTATGVAGDAGTVTLTTEDGPIYVNGAVNTYSGARGTASSCGAGGDVVMTAVGGGIIIGDGGINATSIIGDGSPGTAGRGGDIRLTADLGVVLPSTVNGDGLWTTCTANDGVATGAGEIEVRSRGGAVDLGTKFFAARSVSANGTAGPGGVVIVNAAAFITGGDIDVSSVSVTGSGGPAGYVDVRAGADILLSRILGTSEGAGGISDGGLFVVDAGRHLRLTGGAIDRPTVDATGLPGASWVVLSHGGGAVAPFVVGDATTNGSAFDVVTTEAVLTPSSGYPQSHFEAPSVWVLGDEPALLVNELDVDQPGTDAGEFIELLNPFPFDMPMELTSIDVVDGSGGFADVLFTPAIRGMSIPASGRLVLCPTGSTLPVCDAYDDFSLPDDGPAAVAVRLTGILEDTVSYEGDTPEGYTEGTGVGIDDPGVEDFMSFSRIPDGTDTNHNANDVSLRCVSPGLPNLDATAGCTSTGGPGLGVVSATPSVLDEGSSVLVSGSFTEPPPTASHTVTILWGDGATTELPLPAGTTTYNAMHVYDDDEFGADAPVDIRVTVSDGLSTDEGWTSVTILNVPPTVDAGPGQMVLVGETVEFSGGFTDPGVLDTHTWVWNFGDGGSDDTTLTPTHVFAAAGTYTVTLDVEDDDGGVGADSLFVEVSPAPPRVVGLDTVARAGSGGLSDGEGLGHPVTVFEVAFSNDMLDPSGSSSAVDVTNPGNYRVVGSGPDGTVTTFNCDPPSGDDYILPLAGVEWDGPSRTAAARVDADGSLALGRWRLILCAGGLSSVDGVALDGDGDGSGGDDLLLDFRVLRTDLLTNPNFDLALAGWTDASPAGSGFAFVAADGEGSSWSGSAQATNTSGPGAHLELNRCVELPSEASSGITLRALVRMDPVAADGSRAGAELSFFAGVGCTGAVLETRAASPLLASTGGGFIPVTSAGRPAGGAVSVGVALVAEADPVQPSVFSLAFDRVSFAADGAIFEDGFEMGDAGEWDATVP